MKILKYPKVVTSILMVLTMFILVSCTSNLESIILSLSTYEENLEVGQTLQINHELKQGEEVISDTINWESTNEVVATIQAGLVRALSEGTTTITANYKTLSQSVVITVIKKSETSYTITFNTDGGTVIEPVNVLENTSVTRPVNPTKEGHSFSNWYLDEEFLEAFDFNDVVTSDLVLYAKYIPNQYRVIFITNQTTLKDDIFIHHGNTLNEEQLTLENGNQAVSGWYLDSDLKNAFDIETVITSDLTLYAKWDVKKLSISFITNDETISKSTIQMNYGTQMSAAQLNIGSKPFHDFDGWYLDSEFNDSFVRTIPLTTSLTLYAKWVEHEKTYYTVNHLIKTSSTTSEVHQTYQVQDVYVGEVVRIDALNIPDMYADNLVVEATIEKDGQTIINLYYGPKGYTYELVFNGGNTRYSTREAMVEDWIKDYNSFAGKTYTLETLPMGSWEVGNIHSFMYSPVYRNKWLWIADYLKVVGSATNKGPVGLLITTPTLQQFDAVSDNNKYAVSYEVRGFIKGEKFTANAAWQSSDYGINDLKHGFWPYLEKAEQKIITNGQFDVTLPTNVYYPYHEFIGWYDNEALEGAPIMVINGPTKVYAKFEEINPVTLIEIDNPIEEMEKLTQYQLNVTILPEDAYNKTLVYSSSDVRIATISSSGLIEAHNEGEVVIKVTSQNGKVSLEFNLKIYPKDDIMLQFDETFNGYITVGDSFNMEAIGVGRMATSEHYSYNVLDTNILTMSEPGLFHAVSEGTTQIEIYNLDTLQYSYKVIIHPKFSTSRIDQLLEILANGHNPVATGVNFIPYYTASEEWSDPRHESVNSYLFDDFVVDRTGYRVPDGLKDSGTRPSTEFILMHDTANLNGGLVAHGNFFMKTDNNVSIHYITGDYGIIQSLSDDRIGWHGGDRNLPFEWLKTGVMATSNEAPYIDIAPNGFYTFNGIQTLIMAPKHTNGSMLDRSYFTYLGPTWDIFEGEYVMGTTYFTTSQQSRGVIATRGGNRHSVGIEMSVNKDGDIMDTVQRTAKLVANLLEQYDLDNSRVILHNTTDGKGDPYTFNNTIYKGSWYFDRFMEFVSIERTILKDFSDAKITLTSNSPLVSKTGRILHLPDTTTEVTYTITVELDGETKSIDLVTVVPGMNTWSQNYGFFKPFQAYSKSDYRQS